VRPCFKNKQAAREVNKNKNKNIFYDSSSARVMWERRQI
jgi:hypothetical protein